jgi:hypothetical protein
MVVGKARLSISNYWSAKNSKRCLAPSRTDTVARKDKFRRESIALLLQEAL